MGQSNTQSQLRNSMVTQVLGERFRDRQLSQQQENAIRKHSMSQMRMALDMQKYQLSALRNEAMNKRDHLSTLKLGREIGEMDRKSELLDRLEQEQITDPSQLDIGARSLLGVQPGKQFGYIQGPTGDVVEHRRGEPIPEGYTPYQKPARELTELERSRISGTVAKSEDLVKSNLNDPGIKGHMDLVNKYANNPYVYIRKEVPGAIYGTNMEGQRVMLPKIKGKQITSKDIIHTAEINNMSVDEILKRIGATNAD